MLFLVFSQEIRLYCSLAGLHVPSLQRVVQGYGEEMGVVR